MRNSGIAKLRNAAYATTVKMTFQITFRCMLASNKKVILHVNHALRLGGNQIMKQTLESEWKTLFQESNP
jgi:hypothetical protein